MARGSGKPSIRTRFRRIATTADCGLQVWGLTRRELFINAALGLHKTIYGKERHSSSREVSLRRIGLQAFDQEGLLVNFLSELLYLSCGRMESWIVRDLRIGSDNSLSAILDVTASERAPLLDIKAVTYHDLKLTRRAGRYYLRVIFDI